MVTHDDPRAPIPDPTITMNDGLLAGDEEAAAKPQHDNNATNNAEL